LKARLRWEYIIKLDCKEMWEVVDFSHLAQVKDQWQVLLNTVMNLQTP
jgi:hypothetical protein